MDDSIPTCSGTLIQGNSKGTQCTRPATKDGYCLKHQSQILYNSLLKDGKKLCKNFLIKGCRTILKADEYMKTCKVCRDKILTSSGKVNECERDGCTYRSIEGKRFCDKHQREGLYELERTTSVRYCCVERGCFEVLEPEQKKCVTCVDRKLSDVKESIASCRASYKKCVNCDKNELSSKYLCSVCIPLIETANKENTIHYISKRIFREVRTDVINGADKRKLFFNLTNEQIRDIIIRPCFFCGFYSDSTFNSVDRLDNNKGYIVSNVTTACSTCNIMRGTHTPIEFIEKLNAIRIFQTSGDPIDDILIARFPKFSHIYHNQSYSIFTNNAKRRGILCSLTSEEHISICGKDCYLCGIKTSDRHMNAIDRYESDKPYTLENSRPCCMGCNIMKKTMSISQFLQHINSVLSYSKTKCYTLDSGLETLLCHRKQIYNADEIYQILANSDINSFTTWAKMSGYGIAFIESINNIELDQPKQIQLDMIQTAINKFNETYTNHEPPTYITANKMLYSIQKGHRQQFVDLYGERYILSSSFQSEFDKVVLSILSETDASLQLSICHKFLKKEKERRHSKITHRANQLTFSLMPIVRNEIITPPDPPAPTSVPKVPKQWKAATVYKFIKEYKECVYKQHILECNTSLPDTFESTFTSMVTTVQSSPTFESVKEYITEYIKELRNVRTLTLLQESANDVLVREDRQQWPAATVVRLCAENKLEQFNAYMATKSAEAHVSSTTFDSSWDRFVTLLGLCEKDEGRLEIIKTFMASQRVQRNRYASQTA